MTAGQATAESLTKAALARIAAMDHAGPRLNAVIALNPGAVSDARSRDAARREGYAFEQKTMAWTAPTFRPGPTADPAVGAAFDLRRRR
jgi:Asp-tRNA(Asn)/Glu-tRNA(Gln) amidotransferase A subunit family amidase